MLNPRLARLTDERIARTLRERSGRPPPPVEPDCLAVALGHVIAGVRRRRGLSQRQLAALLGVNRSAVSRWEAAQRFPTLLHLAAIARLDHRRAAALLGEAEELVRLAPGGDAPPDGPGPGDHALEDDRAADD